MVRERLARSQAAESDREIDRILKGKRNAMRAKRERDARQAATEAHSGALGRARRAIAPVLAIANGLAPGAGSKAMRRAIAAASGLEAGAAKDYLRPPTVAPLRNLRKAAARAIGLLERLVDGRPLALRHWLARIKVEAKLKLTEVAYDAEGARLSDGGDVETVMRYRGTLPQLVTLAVAQARTELRPVMGGAQAHIKECGNPSCRKWFFAANAAQLNCCPPCGNRRKQLVRSPENWELRVNGKITATPCRDC